MIMQCPERKYCGPWLRVKAQSNTAAPDDDYTSLAVLLLLVLDLAVPVPGTTARSWSDLACASHAPDLAYLRTGSRLEDMYIADSRGLERKVELLRYFLVEPYVVLKGSCPNLKGMDKEMFGENTHEVGCQAPEQGSAEGVLQCFRKTWTL
jgi:hypothetical protein